MKRKIALAALIIAATTTVGSPSAEGAEVLKDTSATAGVTREFSDVMTTQLNNATPKTEKTVTRWVSASGLNVRTQMSTNSKIVGTLPYNKKVKVVYIKKSKWCKIQYKGKTRYICSKYLSNEKATYESIVTVPSNSGYKSYTNYRCITSTGSPQYKLQHKYAFTGDYGIRQVQYGETDYFCIAMGSACGMKVGDLGELVLKNGTIIPIVITDSKADKDTDSSNWITASNGCIAEFYVDSNLSSTARRMGDVSYCCDDWHSSVKELRKLGVNIMK